MEAIEKYIFIVVVLAVNYFVARGVAYLFTEVRRPLKDRKPFNCYGCLAFWLTSFLGVGAALAKFGFTETAALTSALAVTLGAINYLTIISKYQIHD